MTKMLFSGVRQAASIKMRPRSRDARRLLYSAFFWGAGLAGAFAGPVVISYPSSASPGDVISLEGSGFGPAPKVYLKGSRQPAPLLLATKTADDATVVVEVPKTSAYDLYDVWIANGAATSPHVVLNAPKPMHFDSADLASGGHFRIFGRNLYVNAQPPAVTLIDAQTNAALKTTVVAGTSSPYHLDVVAPAGVIAGHSYQASVSNGYASALTQTTILGHAPGADPFQIGEPWAYDFIAADGPGYKAGVKGTNQGDHHVFNVKSDPSLKTLAKGDGKTDNSAAINGALAAAAAHGGVVYLPPGTYFVGAATLWMQQNVVLRGAGASSTKITMTPTATAHGGFMFSGGLALMGIVDLSVQNTDRTSLYQQSVSCRHQAVSKVFLQRVNWDLGSGWPISLTGDRIAILNSTFTQAINFQNGDPKVMTGGIGPIELLSVSNLHMKGNVIKWPTNQNKMIDLDNAIIENNTFTRSASDWVTIGPAQMADPYYGNVVRRGPSGDLRDLQLPVKIGQKIQRGGRQLAIAFGTNTVLQNNVFNVSDGQLQYTWGDGETIQNEAANNQPREDWGTVTAADSLSVTDNSKCPAVCPWRLYPNSRVVIVSGAGAGQWRSVVATAGNMFTIDKPFDVIPAVGDHLVVSSPAFENTLIRNNALSDNPMGIDLYHGALLNVSVIGNKLTNNGGIELISTQRNDPSLQVPYSKREDEFNVHKNIEINGNTVANTNGRFPAFIAVAFQLCTQSDFWGKSELGVEVRNNQIVGRPGTSPYRFADGYKNLAAFQSAPLPYLEDRKGALYGTVFEGNRCTNCAVSYTLSTGSIDATIWNPITATSPGIAATLVQDTLFPNTKQASIGTLVGHD